MVTIQSNLINLNKLFINCFKETLIFIILERLLHKCGREGRTFDSLNIIFFRIVCAELLLQSFFEVFIKFMVSVD